MPLKEYFADNKQFFLIGLLWLFVGIYLGPVHLVFIPAMLFLMYRKELHLEILLGFFLVLIWSDSRSYQLGFAASIKNVYILLISLFSYLEMKKEVQRIDFYKYFIPFFTLAFICVLFNPNMFLSFQKVLSYTLLFCFFPNYFLFVYLKYGHYLFKGLVFLVTVLILLGFGLGLLSSDVVILAGRYRGLLGNPNGLGLFLYLFIILFAVIIDKFPHVFSKYERAIVYAICFISLLKCGARSSLMAVLMFFFFKRFYKLSPILGFFIFIITLFVYQLVSQNLVDIILALGLGDQLRVSSLESGSGRLVAWQFAWQKIQDNFFFGSGFNYTEYIYRQNYEYLSKLGHQGSAHNSYLTIWLDTGLVGLLCFLIALLTLFLKAAKKSTVAIPFLYTVLFSNYYESWLTASLNPFTIQFLLILSVIYLNTKKSVETNVDSIF